MCEKLITMVKGDTLSFGMLFEDLEQDLDSAFFSCKTGYEAATYIFQKTLGDGITKTDTGKYVVRVAPADTVNVEPGNYYYDLQVGVNGDKFTIMRGVITIVDEVTTN